jgi:signal transduction histidine kinase
LLLLEIDFYKLTNEPIKALEYASKLNVYLENKYNDIFQRSIIEDTKTLVNKFGGIAETALEDKVSELKTTNKELYSQKALLLESFEELKTETQLREKLISIITHDIRSPLASILELLQQIDDFEDKAERDEIIREIISEMNKTYSLTNELVSWAKDVREGQQTMLSTLTCAELIPDITELFSHQIKAKDVRIHNNLTDKYKIIAHKTSLQTCFRNLIQNAIKYSNPQGNIWINEVVRGDSISYLIKDEGIGINGETCSKLFDSANISTMGTNNEKGIGLGLILVKELVFRNKGSIKCDSEIGQGTTFTLTFKIDSVKESDNSQEEYSA